jgi:hypothetical protein
LTMNAADKLCSGSEFSGLGLYCPVYRKSNLTDTVAVVSQVCTDQMETVNVAVGNFSTGSGWYDSFEPFDATLVPVNNLTDVIISLRASPVVSATLLEKEAIVTNSTILVNSTVFGKNPYNFTSTDLVFTGIIVGGGDGPFQPGFASSALAMGLGKLLPICLFAIALII